MQPYYKYIDTTNKCTIGPSNCPLVFSSIEEDNSIYLGYCGTLEDNEIDAIVNGPEFCDCFTDKSKSKCAKNQDVNACKITVAGAQGNNTFAPFCAFSVLNCIASFHVWTPGYCFFVCSH